jgi:hypothetical protein
MFPGSANTTSSTPPNPMTSPAARRRVIVSASAKRAMIATKNGAELASTAATAAPARSVPTLIPTCVKVVFPNPMASAHSHDRRDRGSRLPIKGNIAVSATLLGFFMPGRAGAGFDQSALWAHAATGTRRRASRQRQHLKSWAFALVARP